MSLPPLQSTAAELQYILDAFVSQALTAGITVSIVTAAASTGPQSPQQPLSVPMLLYIVQAPMCYQPPLESSGAPSYHYY